MKKTIGENLRILRLRNSLSMQEAGKRLGISAPGLLKYERNQQVATWGGITYPIQMG